MSFTTVLPGDTPILNHPYLARQLMRAERHLPDGTLLVREFDVTEGRNAAGVTTTEMHLDPNSPAATTAQDAMDFHLVADPAHRTMLQWNNLNHTAILTHIPTHPVLLNAPEPPRPESLGHRVVAGYDLTGTRTERQTPGASAGSATPLRSVAVVWHSDALNADLERTQTNPESGTDIWTLLDVKVGEPDVALFHPPAGYGLNDIPLPGSGSVSRSTATQQAATVAGPLPEMSYQEAMAALEQHDTASTAAAVLIKLTQAMSDLTARDRAIYAVARRDLDLPEMEILANADVAAAEAALKTASTADRSHDTFQAEHLLAHCWDTLGYTLEKENKDGTRWLLAAWTVDPLGYYGGHLGHAYESKGETADAVAIYQAALMSPGSDREKQGLAERVAALTGQAALPPPASAAPQKRAVVAVMSEPNKQSTVSFVSGEAAVGAAGAIAAGKARASWRLPDEGPEHIVRFVAVDCSDADHCTTANLPLNGSVNDR